jgi:hypothetical protein
VSGSKDGEIRKMLKKKFGLGMGKAQKVLSAAKKLQKLLAPPLLPPPPTVECASCWGALDAATPGYWLPGCQKPLEHGKTPYCAKCLMELLLHKERFRQGSDGTMHMPPSTYFCAPPPSGTVSIDQPSCGRDVEEDGLRSELIHLRASFGKMMRGNEEASVDVRKASLRLLLSCPSLYALREEDHEARIKLLGSIESHVNTSSNNSEQLEWEGMLLPWFQQAMKDVHPQTHLMELVDTFV